MTSGRVLIIDDDGMVRATLRMVLEDAGYEVQEAENGRRGVELFRRSPPDVVITDIIMPEQEGIETIIELRKQSPSLPIIAISGGVHTGTLDVLAFARRLGADEILAKPFGPGEMVEAVERILGRRGA